MDTIKLIRIFTLLLLLAGGISIAFSQETAVNQVFGEKGGSAVIETGTLGQDWEDGNVHDENSLNGKDFSGYSGTGYIGFSGNSETSGNKVNPGVYTGVFSNGRRNVSRSFVVF